MDAYIIIFYWRVIVAVGWLVYVVVAGIHISHPLIIEPLKGARYLIMSTSLGCASAFPFALRRSSFITIHNNPISAVEKAQCQHVL